MQSNIIEKEKLENKIIDLINATSGGRLIAFKPENMPGIDLISKKKADYKGKEVKFQIFSELGAQKSKIFKKEILQDSLKLEKDVYLVFARFDELKNDIEDFIWVIPSLKFADIADASKSSDKKTILTFEAAFDRKDLNKFSKFLAGKKELGGLLINLLENGESFDADNFSKEGEAINFESLKDFITEARSNILSGSRPLADNPRLLGSYQVEFQSRQYFYLNIFFKRENKIIGQEIVYLNNRPVWAMNYFGQIAGGDINDFLNKAMLELAAECRLGKKCQFVKHEFEYQDNGEGNLEEFSGQEQILKNKKVIYKLDYQGGVI